MNCFPSHVFLLAFCIQKSLELYLIYLKGVIFGKQFILHLKGQTFMVKMTLNLSQSNLKSARVPIPPLSIAVITLSYNILGDSMDCRGAILNKSTVRLVIGNNWDNFWSIIPWSDSSVCPPSQFYLFLSPMLSPTVFGYSGSTMVHYPLMGTRHGTTNPLYGTSPLLLWDWHPT